MSETLKNIDHIVVVMLENRSFDNMLGYLTLEGGRTDVDGLTGKETNLYEEKSYHPARLDETTFKPDPGHDWDDVAEQVSGNNGGFVRNFASINEKTKKMPGRIMGYHYAPQVGVFDECAKRFTICNRWYASVPGPTQPNRAYAISGTSEGYRNNVFPPRLFASKTVFHYLDESNVSWKYYSHDIAALRFNKHYVTSSGPIDKFGKFVKATKQGRLPAVSWIDPDFGIGFWNLQAANDDHPPHDIQRGQRLVGLVLNLLQNAANDIWQRTLLIVTYDEHGGFYDHRPPPQAEDDHADFTRYGVRVPAFVISPWVRPSYASNDTFDHTSIIKTILRRFCSKNGKIPSMGKRVDAARDLGILLTEAQPSFKVTEVELPVAEDFQSMEEREEDLKSPTDWQRALRRLRDYCVQRGILDDEL